MGMALVKKVLPFSQKNQLRRETKVPDLYLLIYLYIMTSNDKILCPCPLNPCHLIRSMICQWNCCRWGGEDFGARESKDLIFSTKIQMSLYGKCLIFQGCLQLVSGHYCLFSYSDFLHDDFFSINIFCHINTNTPSASN